MEQIWHGSKWSERDAIQSLILTAAGFVHYQKNEPDVCLSVLKRAREKIADDYRMKFLNLDGLKRNLDLILGSGRIQLFKLGSRSA